MAEKTTDETLLKTVGAFLEEGSQGKAAAKLGIGQPAVSKHLKEAKARGLWREHGGSVEAFQSVQAPLPGKGKRRVYYFSSAQNNTKLHAEWWANLLALVKEDNAKLMISCFKYNKDAQGQRAASKSDAAAGVYSKLKPPQYTSRQEELEAEYPHEIVPFVCDDRIDIAPNLTFCGELNVLPTAMNPLEGLENYTFRRSTIVPHPKFAMMPIPTMKTEGVKLMYTTGAVTQRNYIKRKVGYMAEHFHTYGALVVEVDDRGAWYCRQIEQGPDGAAHDVNRRAINGKVEYQPVDGGFVEDICWGDIHAGKLDKKTAHISFGLDPNSMLEVLRPKSQHVHDLLDFSGRSHHTRKDPHEVYRSFKNGQWELTQELDLTADVLWNQIARPWCKTFVVNSNHDRHLVQWLKEADWRYDPANAKMILALNLLLLQSIDEDKLLNMTEEALKVGFDKIKAPYGMPVTFLAEDESHIILPDIDGGIEGGLHGDRGSNGAKGSLETFSKLDRKTNTADKHWAGIKNHAYQCGLTGKLDQGYNHGLSSWTQAHIVTYTNGTRAIYSLWKGKWRA